MEKKGWRNLAIIFMILIVLLGAFIFWMWSIGNEMIENENECALNICMTGETYYYDDTSKVCYCYQDGELVHLEYLS